MVEARARRLTLPYRAVFRAEIVLLAAQGLRNAEIAERLNSRREVPPPEDQVMTAPPYATARRVFWIVDNGSSHRGERRYNGCRAATATSACCTARSTPPG